MVTYRYKTGFPPSFFFFFFQDLHTSLYLGVSVVLQPQPKLKLKWFHFNILSLEPSLNFPYMITEDTLALVSLPSSPCWRKFQSFPRNSVAASLLPLIETVISTPKLLSFLIGLALEAMTRIVFMSSSPAHG